MKNRHVKQARANGSGKTVKTQDENNEKGRWKTIPAMNGPLDHLTKAKLIPAIKKMEEILDTIDKMPFGRARAELRTLNFLMTCHPHFGELTKAMDYIELGALGIEAFNKRTFDGYKETAYIRIGQWLYAQLSDFDGMVTSSLWCCIDGLECLLRNHRAFSELEGSITLMNKGFSTFFYFKDEAAVYLKAA
jgi:hypothetical protein